jgi:DNA-binding transcriptional MocR family regulator
MAAQARSHAAGTIAASCDADPLSNPTMPSSRYDPTPQSQQQVKKLTQHWLRRLAGSERPAYLLIADLIEEDIRDGRLSARDKLPTLRVLAERLQLDYTTVARGYSEARKRGLIDSCPGLGSFVRNTRPSFPLRAGSNAEMTMNLPPEPEDPALLERMHESASRLLAQANLYKLLRYQDFGGLPEDKDAAVQWLRQRLPDCQAERVLVCSGIHSALAALVSQLARPGELICVEALTYPGMKAIASQLGVQLHPLSLDDEGPSAAEFELACKTLQPKALYCNPTLLNPTTTTISRRRREALADIALRYSIPIIEDDAYAMLPRKMLPTLASLAPDLTYYITGLSKFLGAGLRTGYVYAPTARQMHRLAGALRATTVMASPVTNAIATQWVMDGTAQRMLDAVREESLARQQLAAGALGATGMIAQPEGFHLWLPLPAGWHMSEFASQLRSKGIGVVGSPAFCTDGDPPNAVRVSLGGPQSRAACEAALAVIAETLRHPQHPEAMAL